MGDFQQAELIYRAEAQYVLSADRKQEIADIYREFADAYFQPPDREKKPDYEKSLEFYQKVLEAGPKPEKRIEVELLIGQCYQNLEKWDEAIGRYTQLVKEHPDHALEIEARFRLGQCQLRREQHAEARRTWQDLLAKHVDSSSPRVAEAKYHLARTYRVPQPPSREDLDLGVAALRSFIAAYPEHELAGQAYLEIAQSYQAHARYEDAAASLQRFLAEPRVPGPR